MPKEYFNCICLSVLLINSVLKRGKNYYVQVFLKLPKKKDKKIY